MKTEALHVVCPRAAGLDVHKMEVTATVRLCAGGGAPEIETRGFSTLARGLDEMVAWLVGHGVEAAVMEGTGVYWQAPFEALERAGIEAILVHAQQVKQLKGRKTDVADSVWLACVCQFGLCTPSHVPPKRFRELRALSRQRRVLVKQRATVRNRVQKIVDRAGVRIGGMLSDIFGLNGRTILDGLAAGREGAAILASLTRHVAHKLEGLGEALSLSLGENDRFMLNDLLDEYDALGRRIDAFTNEIDKQLKPWRMQLRLLTTIPGIDRDAASTILIEIGPDIGAFASKERFAAWGRLGSRQRHERRKAPERAHPQGVPGPCAPPSSNARTAQPEPKDASSKPTIALSPPDAATSAPLSPARTRCCASSMSSSKPPSPTTTAPPTTKRSWSSATRRDGSECSGDTDTSPPSTPNPNPPDRQRLTPSGCRR